MPFDDGGFFAVLEDAQERVGAELPDVDVFLHVGRGGDVVGAGWGGGGDGLVWVLVGAGGGGRRGVAEGAVVPAEAVYQVLEFVGGREVEIFREGGGVDRVCVVVFGFGVVVVVRLGVGLRWGVGGAEDR